MKKEHTDVLVVGGGSVIANCKKNVNNAGLGLCPGVVGLMGKETLEKILPPKLDQGDAK